MSTSLASALVHASLACTSIMVGPKASANGAPWVGQSDDGEGAGDPRLVWVPPLDWPPNSLRPVYDYEDYPRLVDTDRRVPAYYPSARLPNRTKNLMGHIPQVDHTYGYYEADYAISNEHGLSFGESTCSARTYAAPVHQNGTALLAMYELSRLAAERTRTSRSAVLLMGAMAEKYGFWGTAPVVGGESILVSDASEQYIFHVLAESNSTGGAIWAAQRIPPDHATIVSNAFVIGNIDANNPDDFLFSSNMHSVARKNGWWDGKGQLHFTRTFSLGEYTSHAYAGRRMWAFYSVVAPSLQIPAEYPSYFDVVGSVYPTSVAPDRLLTRDDLLRRVYRNYYAGNARSLQAGGSKRGACGGRLRRPRALLSLGETDRLVSLDQPSRDQREEWHDGRRDRVGTLVHPVRRATVRLHTDRHQRRQCAHRAL
jgi:dipeptidase